MVKKITEQNTSGAVQHHAGDGASCGCHFRVFKWRIWYRKERRSDIPMKMERRMGGPALRILDNVLARTQRADGPPRGMLYSVICATVRPCGAPAYMIDVVI